MVPLIVLLLVLVLVVFPLWALIRITSLGAKSESLEQKIDALDWELKQLREKIRSAPTPAEPEAAPAPIIQPAPAPVAPPPVVIAAPLVAPAPAEQAPPPLPSV